MDIKQIDLNTWESILPSTGFEVFHTPEALRVIDEYTNMEMRLYACYKGEKPVGMIPIFLSDRSIGNAVFSPPPSLGIPRLGPILLSNSPKQRKRESDNDTFIQLLTEKLGVDSRRTLFRLDCPLSYTDPRPFTWEGPSIEPNFTYVLDLESRNREDVLNSYTRDLRKEIRKRNEIDIDISTEGPSAAERVYEHVEERYDNQDEESPGSPSFARDLADALGERCNIYIARGTDGSYLSGVIVLGSNDHALFWQGGVRADYDSVSVNSLLHWEIITDLLDETLFPGVSKYDLVGANYRRLSRYKSKFNGDLVQYYTVESSGPEMALAKKAYNLVSK